MKKIIIGLLSLVLLVLVGIGIIKASNEEWMPLVINDTNRDRTMKIFAKGDTYFEIYDDIEGNIVYIGSHEKRDGYNMVLNLYNYALYYPHLYLKIYGDKKDIRIEDGTTFDRAWEWTFANPKNPNEFPNVPWNSPMITFIKVNLISNKGYMFDVAGLSNSGSDSIEIYNNSYNIVDKINENRIYFKAEYTGTYYIKLKGAESRSLAISVQEWLYKNQTTINYGDSGELNFVYKINPYRDLYLESNNINKYIIDNNYFRTSSNNKLVVSTYNLGGNIVNLKLEGNKNETSNLTLRDGSNFSNAYPINIKDDGVNLRVLWSAEKGKDVYFEEYFDTNLSYQLDFGQSKQLIIYDSNEREVYRTESYDTLEYPNYKRNITFKPDSSGTYYIRVILPDDNNGSITTNNVFLNIGKVYPLDTNLNITIKNDDTKLYEQFQNMYGYHLVEGRTYIFNLNADKLVRYRIEDGIDGSRSYNEGYTQNDTIIFKPEKTQNYFFKFTGENGTHIGLENSGGLTGLQAFAELRKQGHSPVNALTLLYDPIDTSSGALLIDKDLLQYYSFNPLQFNIHYNSLLLEEGYMGKGWNHDFDIKLVQDYRYSYGYIVKWNQNNFTIFDKQTDGTYKSSDPQFVGAVLSENPYVYQGFNLVLKDGSSYKFSEGKLKEYRNSKQDVFEYTYGAYDKISQVYQPSTQHKLNFFYNSQGLLEKVTDNLNREVLFEYTGNLLTKFTDANGNDFSYTYNNQGQILTGTDSNGVEYLKNVYDTFGRITEQTDGMGNTSTLNYDDISSPDEIITTTTNREGDTKTLVHSATTHQLIKTIDEMGKIREFSYDSAGNLIKETDEDGNVYSKGYDSLNNLISSINPLNEEVKLGYTDNKLSSIQNGIYGEIKNVYDGNNLTEIEDALKNKTTFTYNAAGLPLSKTDSLQNTTNYTYKNGQLSSITDPENNTTYFEYDAVGRLINQVDANGNRYEYQYDSNSNVLSIKDPLYEQTFSYNNYNQVLTEKNKAGVTTSHIYNNNGKLMQSQIGEQSIRYERDKEDRIIKLIDSKGLETSWTYSPSGYITLEKNANNEEIQINYDNRYNIIQKIINGNISNSYKYDALNRVTEETDSENKTTKYEYQGNNLIKVINPDGSYYSYTYDLNNNVLTTTDNLDNKILYSYENNNLKTWTDANRNTTTYNYDGNNVVTSIIDPLNHSKSIQYDSNGNAVAVTNELNETTHQNYDALNRLTSVTDALGNTVRYEYDALDNITAIYDASGKKVKGYSYDNYNNLTSEIDALGQSYEYQYDLNNNLSKIIDPLDRVQEQSVDNVGRVVSVIDTNNIESSQSLNIYDEITSITNPNQFTTSLLYNKSGQILQETNSLGTSNHYGYNSAGQLSSYKNYRGQEATYEFEGGRLKKITDNVGTIEYTYDNNSNVTEINENNNTLKYEYDALNRLISYTDENNFTISYEYDAAGQLVKLIYPFDKEVLYSYDSVGNLKDVTDWNNRITSYSYDVNNRLIGTLKPDGSQELRTYDDKGQVISLKNISANGEIISNDTMLYNAVGNITAENNKSYTYDSLDRLINVGNFDNSDNGTSYEFDNAGNITSITSVTKSVYEDYENISITDSVYEEENNFTTVTDSVYFNYDPDNRLISYNGITLNYDADGNLLSIPNNDILLNATYDSRNRLIQVGNTEYIYNSENQRTGIIENEVQRNFIINPNATFSQLLVETDADGNPTSFYVYGLGLISKEDVSGNTYYYHFDKRGSTIALTNSVGSITDTYEYDEYGVILNSTGTTENSFKYVGQYGVVTDSNGLYFMRSRYYHPELKRFINQDTVTGDIYFAQTLNRYSYVNGNPISYIDPLGTTRTLDNIHNTLDVAGFIPGVGIVADVLNGVVYLATGEYGYASLALVAAVPVIGDMTAAGKIGLKTISHVDELSDAYKLEKCLACFTSGTHIATKQGQKPIEDIEIGDEVLSKNEDTGEVAYKSVTNLFKKTITETYNIVIGNETITTSNYHPFYVQGQGWTFAKDLRSDDLLVDDNGQTLKIDDIIVKKETKVVYNFEVVDFHTYFVSNLGVWTHNSACDIAFNNWLKKYPEKGNNFDIYRGYNEENEIVYVGLSNNPIRRQSEHVRDAREFSPIPLNIGNLTYQEARTVEQLLIETYVKQYNRNGVIINPLGRLENKINSISPDRDIYNAAMDYAKNILEKNNLSYILKE